MSRISLICFAGLAALASLGGVTLDEKFQEGGLLIGATGRSWDAKELVGDNRGVGDRGKHNVEEERASIVADKLFRVPRAPRRPDEQAALLELLVEGDPA